MKNITLSAPEELIEEARKEALVRRTTLNQMFRDWLAELQRRRSGAGQTERSALLKRLRYARAGKKFSRDEMNERRPVS